MKQLLFFSLLIGLKSYAHITELPTYKQLNLNNIDQNTLVVFDIDNTLIRQNSMVGTHQWGDYIKERALQNGLDSKQANELQHKSFADLQPYVKVVPTETITGEILLQLKQKQIAHFALTARSSTIKSVTLQQLKQVGFNFTEHFPKQKELGLLGDHLQNGVIFSGDTPKGELLKLILDNSEAKFTKIIFIDDRLYNLESVEKSLANTGYELTSYRYGGVDSVVKSFDSQLADIEYSFFKESGILITDAQAEPLKNNLDMMVDIRMKNHLASVKHTPNDFYCEANHYNELQYTCSYYLDAYYGEIDSYVESFLFKRNDTSKNIYFGNW